MDKFEINSLLTELDVTVFLAHYWQQKPLLIRGALPDFVGCIQGNAIVAEAMNSDCPSRLIISNPSQASSTIHGPFANIASGTPEEKSLDEELKKNGCSLLVQHLQRKHPRLRELENAFNFIPAWRREDVMASLSSPQGSVGLHADRYDVFLVQTEGQRRWKVSLREEEDPLIDAETYPGDVLYIPPGVFHWGVTAERAITLSVGFRAPSCADLLNEVSYALDSLAQEKQEQLFADSGRIKTAGASDITALDINNTRELLISSLQDDRFVAELLGRTATFKSTELGISGDDAPPVSFDDIYEDAAVYESGEDDESKDLDLIEQLDDNSHIMLNPVLNAALYRHTHNDAATATLFIAGESFDGPEEFFSKLSNSESVSYSYVIENNLRDLLIDLADFLTLADK